MSKNNFIICTLKEFISISKVKNMTRFYFKPDTNLEVYPNDNVYFLLYRKTDINMYLENNIKSEYEVYFIPTLCVASCDSNGCIKLERKSRSLSDGKHVREHSQKDLGRYVNITKIIYDYKGSRNNG